MSQPNENITMSVENGESNNGLSDGSTTPTPKTLTQEQQNELLSRELTVSVRVLVNVKRILDIVSSRGVFKGSEMSSVGSVYNELETLISSSLNNSQ